jgi:hypothetical protein
MKKHLPVRRSYDLFDVGVYSRIPYSGRVWRVSLTVCFDCCMAASTACCWCDEMLLLLMTSHTCRRAAAQAADAAARSTA